MLRALLRGAVVFALVIGCGGETGSGAGTAASDSQIERFCTAQCEASNRCPDGPPAEPTCVDECIADLGALADHVRADLIGRLADCFRTLECGTNDDICTERALEAAGYDPEALVDTPDFRRCMEKHEACDDTEGSFSDDLCGTQFYLVASARNALARCLERPCEQLPECLAPIFGD